MVGGSWASTASSTPNFAHAARNISRCATFRDRRFRYTQPPYNEWGVYIETGPVSCSSAVQIGQAIFEGKGTGQKNGTSYRGFLCGGQMGEFLCRTTTLHPERAFSIRGCGVPHVRCPATVSGSKFS
jgi:hypothetical protein